MLIKYFIRTTSNIVDNANISNEVDENEIFQNSMIYEGSAIGDTENEINMNTSNLPGPSQYDRTNYQTTRIKETKILKLLSSQNCYECWKSPKI